MQVTAHTTEGMQDPQLLDSVPQKKASPAKRTLLLLIFMLAFVVLLIVGANASGLFDEPDKVGEPGQVVEGGGESHVEPVEGQPGDEVKSDSTIVSPEAEVQPGDVTQARDLKTRIWKRASQVTQSPRFKIGAAIAAAVLVAIIAVVVWQLSQTSPLDDVIGGVELPKPDPGLDADMRRAQELARAKDVYKEQLFWKSLANGLMPLCGLAVVGLLGVIYLFVRRYKGNMVLDGNGIEKLSILKFMSEHKLQTAFSLVFLVLGIAAAAVIPSLLVDHINLFSLLSIVGLPMFIIAIALTVMDLEKPVILSKSVKFSLATVVGILGSLALGVGIFMSVLAPLLF